MEQDGFRQMKLTGGRFRLQNRGAGPAKAGFIRRENGSPSFAAGEGSERFLRRIPAPAALQTNNKEHTRPAVLVKSKSRDALAQDVAADGVTRATGNRRRRSAKSKQLSVQFENSCVLGEADFIPAEFRSQKRFLLLRIREDRRGVAPVDFFEKRFELPGTSLRHLPAEFGVV